MNEAHVQGIDALMAVHQHWKPSSIELELEAFDKTTGEHVLQTVNLVDVIGTGHRSQKDKPGHRFYLPRNLFNTNTQEVRKSLIRPYIAKACCKAGFEICMRGWFADALCIRFCCSQSLLFEGKQSVEKNKISAARKLHSGMSREVLTADEQKAITDVTDEELQQINAKYRKEFRERNSKTSRPLTKEATCGCSFPLFWEPSHGLDIKNYHHSKSVNQTNSCSVSDPHSGDRSRAGRHPGTFGR